MNSLHFCMILLLCLAQGVVAQKRNETQKDHIMEIKPKKSSDIPAQIRKCINVTCGSEQQCFYGKCIKHDTQCINVTCQKGYRCKLGKCQKQLHSPKKIVCEPLNFKLQKKKCSEELLKTCKTQALSKKVCGFNRKNRKFFDYSSPCQACGDQICHINFYYETQCHAAPRICSQEEECLNGLCMKSNNAVFANYRSCNSRSDCKANEECAFHKCIDKAVLLSYLQSVAQEQSFLLKIA